MRARGWLGCSHRCLDARPHRDSMAMVASGATAIPLLRTKLQRPGRRAHHVHRPAAIALLREGPTPSLTLVDAPAGFGKTTLVADWCAEPDTRSVAWVTLDAADGDPERFWAYVLAAVASADPRLSIPLALTERGALHSVVPPLVDALDVADRPITLVLDDYHRLNGG